jgi:type IV pilus assembly protein PilX
MRIHAMNKQSLLKNQDGSVLILGLIMLMLLTIMGVSVSTTSTIEVQIAGNDKFYKQNLYMAEAAALAKAQEMEDDPNLISNPEVQPQGSVSLDDVRDDSYWEETGNSYESTLDSQARCIPIYEGIAPGSSLDITKPTVHQYGIYARFKRASGRAIVRVGYRRAF